MVLLEAMAAGCPIIATDVGGNATAIKDSENGSLIKAKNPNLLSDEILNILSDNRLKKKYTANGLKTFKGNFDSKIMTGAYEKLYQRTSNASKLLNT